ACVPLPAAARGTTVKSAPAEEGVRFLSFSGEANDSLRVLARLSDRDWSRVRQWLDNSGLTLYFLQKLNDAGATDTLPKKVLSQLERDFASNRRRVAMLSRCFAAVNCSFDDAGIRYAVVKGFSLVPDFCASADLRYQGDFDYLIQVDSLPTVRQIILDA